jgi:hypothetical protein
MCGDQGGDHVGGPLRRHDRLDAEFRHPLLRAALAQCPSRVASSASAGTNQTSLYASAVTFGHDSGRKGESVATIEVQPRPTPEERADTPVQIEVDDELTVFVASIEDWAAERPSWEWTLHEGHDFGRHNNVEGHLLFVAGEQTSSLRFRLDQLDVVDELMGTLMLRFEETKDGIAKVAWATANGLDVELFHIVANI